MRENMKISVNGESRLPPGFRFHPTEEELLQYYLRKKVSNQMIDLDVILEVDLNRLEPWDIQERCKIGSTPQNEWYFFSHKDKKYPTGTRTNRATVAGFWKATGRDKVIYSNSKRIGMRKTLVFYKGRAPHGLKSDWIMHEYRLDDTNDIHVVSAMNGEITQEEGWVVCRIFMKKSLPKSLDSRINTSSSTFASMLDSSSGHDHDHHHHHDHHDQGALERIFQSMGAKPQKNNMVINAISSSFHADKFMKLPGLESPTLPPDDDVVLMPRSEADPNPVYNSDPGLTDWTALDRFVATHLTGQDTTETMGSPFPPPPSSSTVHHHHGEIMQLPPLRSSPPSTSSGNKVHQSYGALDNSYGGIGNEIIDLWSFTRSSSSSSPSLGVDLLCHVSNVGL